MLRIEDLDAARAKPAFVDATLADLAWLGLDWDGAPCLQSAGLAGLADAAATLERAGLAYACVCSRKTIEAVASAPHADTGELRYPGTCRARFADRPSAERASGRPAGLRLRVEPGTITLTDRFAGPFEHDVEREVGDFLIQRRDGAFAYQLACVVDDARQGVTEVVRGDDLLASTPRQWLLQRALGLPHPDWYHVPLVLDASGRRLAKRHDALALAKLRADGVDPRALVAWAARSAGQACGERIRADELVDSFSWTQVPHTAVGVPAL